MNIGTTVLTLMGVVLLIMIAIVLTNAPEKSDPETRSPRFRYLMGQYVRNAAGLMGRIEGRSLVQTIKHPDKYEYLVLFADGSRACLCEDEVFLYPSCENQTIVSKE